MGRRLVTRCNPLRRARIQAARQGSESRLRLWLEKANTYLIEYTKARVATQLKNGTLRLNRGHLSAWMRLEALNRTPSLFAVSYRATGGRDQAAFDLWRNEYNHERPHETLGMKRPAEVYTNYTRIWSGTPDVIDYGGMAVRRVRKTGTIRYKGEIIAIPVALRGWSVGLSPRSDGLIEVWFAELLVGHLDPKTSSFSAVQPDRAEAGQTEMKV